MWTPYGSNPAVHGEWVEEDSNYPKFPRFVAVNIHADGANTLVMEGVHRLFEVLHIFHDTPGYDEVSALHDAEENDVDDSTVVCPPGYDAICSLNGIRQEGAPVTCPTISVTAFWNHNSTVFEEEVSSDEDVVSAISIKSSLFAGLFNPKDLIGNLEIGDDGTLTFAQAYLLGVELPPEDGSAKSFQKVVINRLLGLRKTWESKSDNPFRFESLTDESFSDEVVEAS